MRAKRVVLLTNRSLLAAGVEHLLQDVDSLELSIVASGDSEAVVKLRRLAPEVIVLDSGDASLGEGVITDLLSQHPRSRVIGLNLSQAAIEIFRVKRVLQTNLDGLLEAIQGKHLNGRAESTATEVRE